MLDSLSSAVSGLDAFQQEMDIIGNNIANINTSGYKDATADLGTSFSNTLQAATAATSTTGGTNPEQIGTGVATIAIENNWSTGTINQTGNSNDLAINGNGFFVVQDSQTSQQYVTQAGNFSINNQGQLITQNGMLVMGTNAGGTAGPIVVSTVNSASTSPMTGYTVSANGDVTVTQADGTISQSGQVLLQSFEDPQQLTSVGDNLYSWTTSAGPLAAAAVPGASGTGLIVSGALELSNVDLSSEMANLITAQRAFEANSKIVTTSDELLQDVVNMKH
jgi:flagellar hook protein FlgE